MAVALAELSAALAISVLGILAFTLTLTLALTLLARLTGLLLLTLLPPSAAVAVRLPLGAALLVELIPGPAQL